MTEPGIVTNRNAIQLLNYESSSSTYVIRRGPNNVPDGGETGVHEALFEGTQ